MAWLSRSMGVLVLDPTLVPLGATVLLVPSALVFALAPRAFPPGRTLVPSRDRPPRHGGPPSGPGRLRRLRTAVPAGRRPQRLRRGATCLLAVVVLLGLWFAALHAQGPRWRARDVGIVLSLALAVALATTGVVGLPLLQPRVEKALASTFEQAGTGLQGESTLGEFAELAVSRRRVLDLRSSDPAAGPWRLPSEVFTRFDGRRWSNAGRAAAASEGERRAASSRAPPGAATRARGPPARGARRLVPGRSGSGPARRRARDGGAAHRPGRGPALAAAGAATVRGASPHRRRCSRRTPTASSAARRGEPLTQYGALLSPAPPAPPSRLRPRGPRARRVASPSRHTSTRASSRSRTSSRGRTRTRAPGSRRRCATCRHTTGTRSRPGRSGRTTRWPSSSSRRRRLTASTSRARRSSCCACRACRRGS